MRLSPKNQRLSLPGSEALHILQEIDLLLISLHRIGSYYAVSSEVDRLAYEHETTRFIDEWRITQRLAVARARLTRCFDLTLGEDDMDDVERAMEDVDYWSNPNSRPREE